MTKFQYLVYANTYSLIIDRSQLTDFNKMVTDNQISTALAQNGYASCKSLIVNPVIFTITICGPFVKSNYNLFISNLIQAWQTEKSYGGGIGFYNIQISIQSQTEILSNDA